jgi:hypothetical protein
MADIANLLDKDGCKYKAKIHNDPVSGELCVENGSVFLLHNSTTHYGGSPTKGMRGYKASWNVHRGDVDGLRSENVKDFELVVSNSAKFPAGTRVKLASRFTGTTTKFQFGGDITTLPSEYGVIASNSGWCDSYKSCKVLVRWDKGSALTYDTYSMLENELELAGAEEAKPAPRDIPGIHRFKVGDKVRIKSGLTFLLYTGAIRGDDRDNGEIRSTEMFDRDKKCMKVGVKFADGRNYTMSEDELEFLPSAPPFHMYVTGDIVEFEGKVWIVIRHDSTGINMEKEDGAKAIILNHKFDTLRLRGHNDKMPIISVGDYLKAEHIETYAGWTGAKSPVGKVPPMATVKVTAVGKYSNLAGDSYHAFSFEWKGDIYDASQGRRNIYTKCDGRDFIKVSGIESAMSGCSSGLHLKDVAPHLIEQEYLGITPIEWHISSSPEIKPSSFMTEEQLRRAREMRDRELYEREARYRLERDRAAYEARMQYGGDLSYLGHTRIGMPYIYETNLISDPPEKKIDPKTNREKYICGVDPFEVEPTPTPDLIMKKEKKFSL